MGNNNNNNNNGNSNGFFKKTFRKAKAKTGEYYAERKIRAKEEAAYAKETRALERKAYRASLRKAKVSAARKRAKVTATSPGISLGGWTAALTGEVSPRAKKRTRTKMVESVTYVKTAGGYKKKKVYRKRKIKPKNAATTGSRQGDLNRMLGV